MDAAREAMQAARGATAAGAPAGGRPTPQAGAPPLEHALGRLWDESRALLHDQLLLASLEARQALTAGVRIIILGVSCAALLLGAWAVAMMAVLSWLLDTGMSVAGALGIVMVSSLVLAAALFWLTRQSVRELAFPATLRRLTSAPLTKESE